MVVIFDSNLAYPANLEIKKFVIQVIIMNNHVANAKAVCLLKYCTAKSVIRYVCRYDLYVCMKVSYLKNSSEYFSRMTSIWQMHLL